MSNRTRRIVGAVLTFFINHGVACAQSGAALHLVFVLDGLRPDSITAADTPNLYRLRSEGVAFESSHSVFPTVTRVNSTSLATGAYPARHGIMGNSIYIPAVDPLRAFTNDDFRMLLKLDEATSGRMVTTPCIAELLEQSGRKMIAVSSGSTGSALLLSPKAPRGTGTVINGDFFPGTQVAYPSTVSEAILNAGVPPPTKGGAKDAYTPSVDWSMQVLRDYVLPELRPAVVFVWMAEPDHLQHALGAGAPQAVAAIRNDDRQIGLVLAKLEELGLRDKTNIMVVSDHGFSQTAYEVNVAQVLTDAGLLVPGSDDLVIASSGQAVGLHVKNHELARILAAVELLQHQPWTGVIFTARRRAGAAHEGMAPGTFALEYAHLGGHERSPDVLFTFRWSSDRNRNGVPGADYALSTSRTGAAQGTGAGHGGIGPWTVRNTMLAWGPDFKRGATVRSPTSNVDIAPTLMHLLGQDGALSGMDGRVMLEALSAGPDHEQLVTETRAVHVRNGSYRAALQTTEVAGKRYIDKGWRED
jgi:arylsulfatase A-like enzyme